MIDKIAYIGMRVVMKMDKEARDCGRKGPKDGTMGHVVGWTRYKHYQTRYGLDMQCGHLPGVYESNGSLLVLWDGETNATSGHDYSLYPVDKDAYERRYQKLWVSHLKAGTTKAQEEFLRKTIRLGDLPETQFYELDRVKSKIFNSEGYISSIHYHLEKDERGTCYSVKLDRGGSSWLHDDDLTLIKRGNVYNHYKGLPLSFNDLRDEAAFYHGLGKTKEVRNPKSNLYKWDLDEVIEAIREGSVDCFLNGPIPLISQNRISALHYEDRNLGERLRQETLKGFYINQEQP